MSAIYDKETLLKLYDIATDKPHSFLYIKVNAKDREDMFHSSFEQKLIPKLEKYMFDENK